MLTFSFMLILTFIFQQTLVFIFIHTPYPYPQPHAHILPQCYIPTLICILIHMHTKFTLTLIITLRHTHIQSHNKMDSHSKVVMFRNFQYYFLSTRYRLLSALDESTVCDGGMLVASQSCCKVLGAYCSLCNCCYDTPTVVAQGDVA